MHIEQLEMTLLSEIEAIDAFLNKGEASWSEIRSALNMLKNKDRKNYHTIKRKLFFDFRMIEDHQISDPKLDTHINRAWEIAVKFEKMWFNK